MRMTAEDFDRLEEQVGADLAFIDEARAELIAGHDDLVLKLAEASGVPLKEATRYARHGLNKAVENYDLRRHQRFESYAQKWIKAAIAEKIDGDG